MVGDPDEPIKNAHDWTLEKIRKEDEKVDKLLDELNPGSYPSKSEADFAVSVKLLYWEFSPGQIKDILRGLEPAPRCSTDPTTWSAPWRVHSRKSTRRYRISLTQRPGDPGASTMRF